MLAWQGIQNLNMLLQRDYEFTFQKPFYDRQSAHIEFLYHDDKDFRELCSDYLLCMQTLNKYNVKLKTGIDR